MNEAFRLLFDQVKSGVVWVERSGIGSTLKMTDDADCSAVSVSSL